MRAGSELYVTVDELKAPDTEATTQTRIENDGTIRLPKLEDRVRVEGLTPTQAQQAIAEAYKAAGVVDQPTVTIEPVADDGPPGAVGDQVAQRRVRPGRDIKQSLQVRPTTQPVQQFGAQLQVQGEQVQRQSDVDAAATTAPTTHELDLDDRVDVVFLVQSNSVMPIDAARIPALVNDQANENDAPNAAASSEPSDTSAAKEAPPEAAKSAK
jgi:protein involved in polysaccharide export with SLBB domain